MIMKLETIFVDTLPEKSDMEVGYIYLSQSTWMSNHLNPFKPEEEIITPHIRGGYRYSLNKEDEITISPDIVSDDKNIAYSIVRGYAIPA